MVRPFEYASAITSARSAGRRQLERACGSGIESSAGRSVPGDHHAAALETHDEPADVRRVMSGTHCKGEVPRIRTTLRRIPRHDDPRRVKLLALRRGGAVRALLPRLKIRAQCADV